MTMTIYKYPARSENPTFDWPVQPFLPGDWAEMPHDEASGYIEFVNRQPPRGIVIPEVAARIRMMSPSFYPGTRLVEGAVQWKANQIALFRMILTEHGTDFLSGVSPAVCGPVDLKPVLPDDEPQVISDWLRFFCSAVHAEFGPFVLIEQATDLEFRSDVPEEVRAATVKAIRKLRRLPNDQNAPGHRRSAIVRYGTSLFAAKFRVIAGGMVRMDDDHPIAENVLVQRSTYKGVWQIVSTGPATAEPEVSI